MKYHYSPSSGGTYGPFATNLPSDVVEISEAVFAAIADAIVNRRPVNPGSDGKPVISASGFRRIDRQSAMTSAGLLAYAADKRWRVETGGCACPEGIVNTDRDSQSKLLAEMVAITAGMRADPSGWKMADGFVLLTNKQMMAVITAARIHVAGAFAIESAVAAGVASGAIVATAQIDAATWPSNR